MSPSAVNTMPVPSSPDVPLVTMIETTDGNSALAICATDSALPCAPAVCAPAVGASAGLDAFTVEADADADGRVATGVELAVFLVAATMPPATPAPTSAAT